LKLLSFSLYQKERLESGEVRREGFHLSGLPETL